MEKKKCMCVCEREGSPSEQYADNEGNGKWRRTIGDCGGGSDGIGGRKREPIAAFPEHSTALTVVVSGSFTSSFLISLLYWCLHQPSAETAAVAAVDASAAVVVVCRLCMCVCGSLLLLLLLFVQL